LQYSNSLSIKQKSYLVEKTPFFDKFYAKNPVIAFLWSTYPCKTASTLHFNCTQRIIFQVSFVNPILAVAFMTPMVLTFLFLNASLISRDSRISS